MNTPNLKLILVDPNPSLCWEWREKFAGLPNVEVVDGYFEDVAEYDCFVSAANSFGLMDGGVDGAIIRYFGDGLMRRVQRRIVEEYLGEQPIGTSMIVETDHPRHAYIAHTPTMRVPMPISRTDNVYTAMWAMLLAVHRHNHEAGREESGKPPIKVVACPDWAPEPAESPYPKPRVRWHWRTGTTSPRRRTRPPVVIRLRPTGRRTVRRRLRLDPGEEKRDGGVVNGEAKWHLLRSISDGQYLTP
jgi:O-acetyl-ADP-ribose deacetylase (regulator of RNase III)